MAAACRLPQVCFHQVVSAISYPLVPSVIFCLCVNDFSIHFLFHIVFFLLPPPPYPYSYSYSILGYSFLSVLFFFFFGLGNYAIWRRHVAEVSGSMPAQHRFPFQFLVKIYIYIYCLSQCVYTKIQLKLLETEVEDGAEEAEVTRKLLGHYLSSDSKSASEFESQRIPVKTLRPARALREIHPKPEVEKICVLPALQKKKR